LNAETERIEVLLALADAFADGAAVEDGPPVSEAREELLSTLDEETRHAVRRRGEWLDRLTPEKRRDWMRHTLARARPATRGATPLDEHLHHSHVTEALRGEPERVRCLVVAHLPHELADACASALGMSAEDARADAEREGGAGVAPEVVAVVRRVFLSNFITLADVERPTPLDFFTGAELARLVRLLGVRETALACRGIPAVEAVAAFLKRFVPEDARAIATHIRTLTQVESWRVANAGQHVQEALRAEPEPGAMLDRTGLRLLATALSGRTRRASLRYAAQKLPVEAARWLRLMAATGSTPEANANISDETAESRRLVAREVEEVAAGLRRRPPRAQGQRPGRRSGPLAPAPLETSAGADS
jgi:flagellar motor switch protein FliG